LRSDPQLGTNLTLFASSTAFFASSIDFFISLTPDTNGATSPGRANSIARSSIVDVSLKLDFGFFTPYFGRRQGRFCRMAGHNEKSDVWLKSCAHKSLGPQN
jgi:hypothetical protein